MPKVSPYIFPFEYQHNGHVVSLKDSNEAICQGGPIVSKLEIDGSKVEGNDFFAGPLLFHRNWVFAPKLTRKFLKGHGFQLLAIDLQSLNSITLIPFEEPMILLSEISNGEIIYFKDKENTELETIGLPKEIL